MEQKPQEPPFRVVNGRKVYDVTTTTDSVKRPVPVAGNEAKDDGSQKED